MFLFSLFLVYVLADTGKPRFIFEKEPNDSVPNGPFSPPLRIEGTVYPATDADTFLIIIQTAGEYNFETFSGGCTRSCSGDTTLELFNGTGVSNGTKFASNDDGGHNLFCSRIQLILSPGNYTVRLTTYNQRTSTTWALAIFDVSGDWDGGCLADFFWSRSVTKTIDYGVAPLRFIGHFESNQIFDVFRVVIPYPYSWIFETFTSNCLRNSCPMDTHISIWDDHGFQFHHDDDDGGLGLCSKAVLHLTPATYLVVVGAYGHGGGRSYDLVIRAEDDDWDGTCATFEPIGNFFYHYKISEMSTGYSPQLQLFWQAHVIDHDKGIAVHTTTDFQHWETAQYLAVPGSRYYWDVAALPTKAHEGFLVTYDGGNYWTLVGWKSDVTSIQFKSTSGTGDWVNPRIASFGGKIHVLFSTNQGGEHDFQLIDLVAAGNYSNPTPLSFGTAPHGEQAVEPSRMVECGSSLWVVWHSYMKDPSSGHVNPSTSVLKSAYYSESQSTWTHHTLSTFALDGAFLNEKDIDCVNSHILVLAICVQDMNTPNHCTVQIIYRDTSLPNSVWAVHTTTVQTTIHMFQDIAVGHTDRFIYIAWVTEHNHVQFSWATHDLSKWDAPRKIGGIASEPLLTKKPSFACDSNVCYLSFLVGDSIARTVKFVSCNASSEVPCIDNGEVVFSLPPETVPEPVTVVPGPDVVVQPDDPQPEPSENDHVMFAFIVVSACVLAAFAVLGIVVIALMAKNQSGCFAPREYQKAPAHEKKGLKGDDREIELEESA